MTSYRTGNQIEIEEALASWLRAQIEKSSGSVVFRAKKVSPRDNRQRERESCVSDSSAVELCSLKIQADVRNYERRACISE